MKKVIVAAGLIVAGLSATACGSATHSAPAAHSSASPSTRSSAQPVAATQPATSSIDLYVQNVFATEQKKLAKLFPSCASTQTATAPSTLATWLGGFNTPLYKVILDGQAPLYGNLNTLTDDNISLAADLGLASTGVITSQEISNDESTWNAAMVKVGHEYAIPAATINWYIGTGTCGS